MIDDLKVFEFQPDLLGFVHNANSLSAGILEREACTCVRDGEHDLYHKTLNH